MRTAMTMMALTLLAGCNRSPTIEATNATQAEVANQMAAAGGAESFVRPGKWATTVSIDAMDAPGIPPEAAARMKAFSAKGHTVETCLTPEEAKKPSPAMLGGNNDQCRYDHFKLGDGKIDVLMRCSGAGPQKTASQVMKMTGAFDDNSYHMAMESVSGAGSAGAMSMKMHLDAKRVGECDAKKAAG